jgi:hypothetical protein
MNRQALFLSALTTVALVSPTWAADGAAGMLELRWGKNAFMATQAAAVTTGILGMLMVLAIAYEWLAGPANLP